MAAGKHLVLATIIEVHPGQVTYPACMSCYTKLHHLSASDKFQCQRCGRLYEVNEVPHRYRLTVKVTSQSACREVTLFGSCLDPFFGTDATAFSRYIQHGTQYHQTTPSEFDILHDSITSTLVGHPFYFGFKTAGNFSVQKCNRTTSCVSLANITGRDSEGLVAVQLTSPFQKWNFPTVLQSLCRIIASREGQLNEQGGFAQCSNRDGCEICTLMALPQNQTAEKVNLGHVTTDHLEEGGADLQEIVDSTCSRSDESCGTNYSLGETFFSSSIPSFRLSCDKTLPTFNKTLQSRPSDDAIIAQKSRSHQDITTTEDCAGCSQNVENDVPKSLHTNGNSVSQESSRQESGSVDTCKSVSSTGKSCTDLELQGCVTKGDLSSERCQKKDSCINIVSHTSDDDIHGPRRRIEETTDDQSTRCCKKSCKATATDSRTIGHEQDPATFNDSSIIQECEQFMNQWLEENSFDRWSYYESRSCVPHSNSPSHGNGAVTLQTHCMEESREQSEADGSCHPELSHSCAESLDDLPFSEDLSQFLHDVEEEYARSKDKELRDLSLHRIHEAEDVSARINDHEKDVTTVSTFGRSAVEEKSAESNERKPRFLLLRRKIHREVEIVRTDGCKKDVTTSSDKFIRLKCNGAEISHPCERTDEDRDFCACDVDHSCGNEKERLYTESPLSESGLCNVSEQDYERSSELDLKCNISTEGVYSQQHDEVADCSVAERKRLGEFIYDDVGDDSVFSNMSVQDEQVQSVQGEDFNQSPLLFSQSQSPIWPVRPSSYLTAQQPQSRFLEKSCCDNDDNSLPRPHKATPPKRGSNQRVPKPNRKFGAPIVQNRTESENLHTGRQIHSQGTPDRRVDVPDLPTSQRTGDENSLQDLPDQGTPCLFSQALPDSEIQSHLTSITRSSRRAYRGKQKATPLRQLFLQRARFWNMSSTPMSSKEKSIAKVERSFESPLSCGTPNLFSSENSLTGDDTSWNSYQGKLVKDSFQKEASTCNSLECTPDLF